MQRELKEVKEEVSKKDDEKLKREKETKENEELHEEKYVAVLLNMYLYNLSLTVAEH